MCCFVKTGLSVSWQPAHRPGTSFLSRDAARAEPCGSWHSTQPCSTGRCLYFTLVAFCATFAWQPAQRSLPAFARLNLNAEPCGSWQSAQRLSATGLCELFGALGTMPL